MVAVLPILAKSKAITADDLNETADAAIWSIRRRWAFGASGIETIPGRSLHADGVLVSNHREQTLRKPLEGHLMHLVAALRGSARLRR